MRPETPDLRDAAFLSLCRELAPGSVPSWLEVLPAAHAQPLECFEAVRRQVRRHGGAAVYGWQVWLWPALFLEAEFHAAWRSPDGRLHDITPKLLPIARIAFLPDPVRVFAGARIPNVRRALDDDPRVARFLAVCDEEWRLVYGNGRARLRDVPLSLAESIDLHRIAREKEALAIELGLAGA